MPWPGGCFLSTGGLGGVGMGGAPQAHLPCRREGLDFLLWENKAEEIKTQVDELPFASVPLIISGLGLAPCGQAALVAGVCKGQVQNQDEGPFPQPFPVCTQSPSICRLDC